MDEKLGYTLIIIGLLWMGFNSGYLNVNLITHSAALPATLLLIGCVELTLHYVNVGNFTPVLKTVLLLLLLLVIFANLGLFLNKFFNTSFNTVVNAFNDGNFTQTSEGVYVLSFTSLNLSSTGTELNLLYDDEENSVSLEDDTVYSFNLNFGNYTLDFSNVGTKNNSLQVSNNFGDTSLKGVNKFNKVVVDSSFADMRVRTGEVTGESDLILTNNFGNVDLFMDEEASYLIERSNSFGVINNHVGLETDDYSSSEDNIHIVIDNNFGTVNVYGE